MTISIHIRESVRRVRAALLAMLPVLACLSCSDPDFSLSTGQTPPSQGVSVTESQDGSVTVTVPQPGGTCTLELSSPGGWSAELQGSRTDSWCSVSPDSGSRGSASLTVSARPNLTYDEREAVLTIRQGDGTRRIRVIQKQMDAILLSGSRIEMTSEGGSADLTVRHNVPYSIQVDAAAADWISAVPTRSLESDTFMVTVLPNHELSRRQGEILLESEGLREILTVFQQGAEPTIVLSEDSFAVSDEGGSVRVDVTANVSVECSIEQDVTWLREDATRGMSATSFVFTVDPNPTYDRREATVTFSDTSGSVSQSVRISQAQKDALVISDPDIKLSPDAQDITVTVRHNVPFTYSVESGADWLSEAVTRSFAESQVRFHAEANPADTARRAVITFSGASLTARVTVSQGAVPYVRLIPDTVTVPHQGGTVSIAVSSNISCELLGISGDWAHSAGIADGVLTVSADILQEGCDGRTCLISVGNEELGVSACVTLVQTGVPTLTVPDTYILSGHGGEFSLDDISRQVISNVGYRIEGDLPQWAQSGFCQANKDGSARGFTVTVTPESEELSPCSVSVIQPPFPVLSAAQRSHRMSADDSYIGVAVPQGASCGATPADGWIQTAGVSDPANGYREIYLHVDANLSEEPRETSVTFTDTLYGTHVLHISQDASEDTPGWINAELAHSSMAFQIVDTPGGYRGFSSLSTLSGGALNSAHFLGSSFGQLSVPQTSQMRSAFSMGQDGSLLDCRYRSFSSTDPSPIEDKRARYGTVTGLAVRTAASLTEVGVDVTLYAKESGTYSLVVLLTEDGVTARGCVMDDVVRAVLGSVLGDEVTIGAHGGMRTLHFSVAMPEQCVPGNMKVTAYVLRSYGTSPRVTDGDYGDCFVDNSASVALGQSIGLALKDGTEYTGNGNEDFGEGGEIDVH